MFAYIATALWVMVSEQVNVCEWMGRMMGVVGCVQVVVSGCVQLMLTVDC